MAVVLIQINRYYKPPPLYPSKQPLTILIFLPQANVFDGVIIMVQTFCYWDAKSKTDATLIIVNQTIVTTLLSIAVLRIPNLVRLRRSGLSIDVGKIALIHGLIILWGISQSLVNYYSIVVFLGLESEVDNEGMLVHSSRYALLSSFPGYTVQTLFITICYTFCRNLVRETDIRRFPNYSFKFVLALKVYFFYRLAVWFLAVMLIILSSKETISAASRAQFVSLIVDSFVINTFIFLSLRIFINRLSHMHFRSMKREYYLMFIFSLCRIMVDSLYLTLSHSHQHFCVSEMHYNWTYSVVYIFIGNYLLHFTPIAVILKIYRFDYREVKEQNQLIPRFSIQY